MLLAGSDALNEFVDGAGLVAAGFVVGDQLEVHIRRVYRIGRI